MLANFLRTRRKQKLIEELNSNPQPSADTFVELVKFYQEDGDLQAASQIAKRGAELYPDSERMLQSRAAMESVMRDLEKERLRQKIESYASPILFGRLAELYKVDGEIEAAIYVCREGIRSFPSYGGSYLVLGEISLENGDLADARVQLEKAAELDKYNYAALKLLAEVYIQLEMPDKAARRLEEILYFAPGDEQITEMLERARDAAGTLPGDKEEATAEVVGTVGDEDAEDEPVAAVIEDGSPSRAPARERDINEAIGFIADIKGVGGALLVDPYGLVIAGDLKTDIDEELAGAMITNIFRAVARSAEPMGIGSFEDGLIEGEGGNIHILGIEDMILAVFASPGVKMGMLEKSIRDFVDQVLD
ncbi:MAG: tetratricopeptide repeat protein [Planctomycetota bacterium]|jgi:predicted regulator of Ras-like GTPase activity (Roadblock/LC7/MglB family)